MSTGVRRVEVAGPALPRTAWERYADLSLWPGWAPQIRSVDADGARLAVGRSGTVHVLGGLRVAFVVTAVDDERLTWSWIARLGPVALTLHHDLSPAPGGTAAGLTVEGPALVVALYAPLTTAPLVRLVRA
ncbi:MAG: SRPBCC family protein [Janthinobacterium lividum]